MIVQALFATFVERYTERLDPAHLELARRLIESLPHLMAQRVGPITVTHGDYRLDNMLFGTAGGGGAARRRRLADVHDRPGPDRCVVLRRRRFADRGSADQ